MTLVQVLSYIYTGRLDTVDVEVLKGIFLAANMLQMSDLEHITVTSSHRTMSPCTQIMSN
jgi:hypothetical protein